MTDEWKGDKIPAPGPLHFISRKALKRISSPAPIPESCPYCQGSVELVNHAEVYNGREYGDWPYIYLCRECNAYVGLHEYTDIPLGTLANRELREARKQEKVHFEALWYNRESRTRAYEWLAAEMKIPVSECHWGMFTVEQCREAGALCRSVGEIPKPRRFGPFSNLRAQAAVKVEEGKR